MHAHPLRTPAAPVIVPHTPPAALVGAAIVFVAYFASLHVLIVRNSAPWLAIGLVVAPWVVAMGAAVRSGPVAARRLRATLAIVAIVALGAIAWTWRDRIAGRVDVLLYVENLIFLIALCGLFAATLSGHREPLITHLARVARGGRLPPQAEGYTRRVTIVWAAFFATMALVSTVLFATQSRVVWSSFVNLAIWPSMVLLFAIEYAVRIRVLRDIPHVPMMRGVDAFRQRHATEPAATASDPR